MAAEGSERARVMVETAMRHVTGDRHESYGHPAADFSAIGRKWGATLSRWLGCEIADIEPRIVALMMVDLKTCREAGHHKADNDVDAVGYLCTKAMCEEDE